MSVNQFVACFLAATCFFGISTTNAQKNGTGTPILSPVAMPTLYQVAGVTPAGQSIPFRILLENQLAGTAALPKAWLINGDEKLELTPIRKASDSTVYSLVVFDAELKLLRTPDGVAGTYVRYDARQGTLRIPFKGKADNVLPAKRNLPENKYAVTFAHPDGTNSYPAVGHIKFWGTKANRQIMHGTFETTTGDYRFLEGEQLGDSLWLSAFDGAHLFLFTAKVMGDSLVKGRFYSTGAGYEVWKGKQNTQAQLPNALERVSVRKDVPVQISLLDTTGKTITLADPQFVGKPVILQVSGTWCPNCMDETQFLSAWYKTDARKDIEVLGLFFERKPEIKYWKNRLNRVKSHQKVPYLLGYAGPAQKDSAAARLPFLSHIEAFPTTIFLNRKHEVIAIHTGYSGPATGAAFAEYKKEFNELIVKILQ